MSLASTLPPPGRPPESRGLLDARLPIHHRVAAIPIVFAAVASDARALTTPSGSLRGELVRAHGRRRGVRLPALC
jgi:hypothetical protein